MVTLYTFALIGSVVVVMGLFVLGMLVRSLNNKSDEE